MPAERSAAQKARASTDGALDTQVLFMWKRGNLPYSSELRELLGLEIFLIFVIAAIESARIFLGSKGNKTEQASATAS